MTTSRRDPAQRRAERGATWLVGWLAVVAHLLLGLPTATLGLVVPVVAQLLLVALWFGLGIVVLQVRPRRPLLALAVPVGYVVVVVTTVTAGGALLGWTA